MPIEIRLEYGERQYAVLVGLLFQSRAENGNYKNKGDGYTKFELLCNHIAGAMGEIAVCRWLHCYYEPRDKQFSGPDIGEKISVRAITKRHYRMLVRPDDNDDECVVCVLIEPPMTYIIGWMWARDAKQEKWLDDPKKRGVAYWVPQSQLKPLEDWPL